MEWWGEGSGEVINASLARDRRRARRNARNRRRPRAPAEAPATVADHARTGYPRTNSARAGEASHCLVPKEDTDTPATADAKRMRRSGSTAPARSSAHANAP
mgnify:CR=1 FL=1